jgi:hypothetical protein
MGGFFVWLFLYGAFVLFSYLGASEIWSDIDKRDGF